MDMNAHPDHQHRRSIRLRGYDYASGGAYFITICTHHRKCVFGRIADEAMQLNPYGCMARDEWRRTFEQRDNVMMDEFVIMPNHFHAIVILVDEAARGDGAARRGMARHAPTVGGQFSKPVAGVLERKKSLEAEIEALDVMAFTNPPLPLKPTEATAQAFRYEGYDIVTMERLFERDYEIPEAQTTEEIIGYYASHIMRDLKLPSQFAVLAPKVRQFLEHKAFGQTVDLGDPQIVAALRSRPVNYVTNREFVKALREVIVEEKEAQLLDEGRALSQTAGFPWSRPVVAAKKCIYNLVPCDNEFEKSFARFLEDAADVTRFAKLPPAFGFAISYTDAVGNLRHYEPDFVAVLDDGTHFLIETKGMEDVHVRHKDRAAALWSENATLLTGNLWRYLKVPQNDFIKLQPNDFGDIAAAFV